MTLAPIQLHGLGIECHEGGVVGVGLAPADIMIIGIAPGKDEWQRSKQPFTGASGKLLNGLLKLVGLGRDQVYTTNLICWWNDAPNDEEIALCLPRLLAEIKAVKPKVIMCLGKIVTESLMADCIDGHKFGKVQGGAFWSPTFKCWMLSTYHPAAYLYHGEIFAAEIHDGVRDFKKLAIYTRVDKDFGHVDYQIAMCTQEADEWMQHFVDTPHEEVAIDVETYYESSKVGKGMISIAFACEHGTYHIGKDLIYRVNFKVLEQAIAIWGFHNGQFDVPQIKEWLGCELRIDEDSMLQSYSLDERAGGDQEADSTGMDRAVGIHGLKRLSREYCAAGFYDDEASGRIDLLTPEEIAYYNSCDANYTRRLIIYFKPLQIEEGVRGMYEEILIPAANVLMEIRERGAYIDPKAVRELAREWLPRWLEVEAKLQEDARALGWDLPEINTGSPKQLSRFIYEICGAPQVGKGKMARSTSRAILKTMVEEYPDHPAVQWINDLIEWRGLDRDVNTYIYGIDDKCDIHHFIHPEAAIHGTRNGRLSYHNPPIQTIPKARTVGASRARIRRIFAAAPPSTRGTGQRLLLEADFRQAELWTAHFVSGDENMLDDLTTCTKCHQSTRFIDGELRLPDGSYLCEIDDKRHESDFHARVAESNWGKTKEMCEPIEWQNLRDSAKITTYGIGYGAGPAALVGEKKLTGRGSTGVGDYKFLDTIEQAKQAIANWLARYGVYKQWRLDEQKYVMKEGEQQSRTGRKRRYYMIQSYHQLNQSINMPISSFAHDFLLAALIELHPLLKEFDAYILWDIHDSLTFDVPRMYLKECAELIRRVMQKPRWGSPCGIPIDAKAGPNWLDLEDLDKVLDAA